MRVILCTVNNQNRRVESTAVWRSREITFQKNDTGPCPTNRSSRFVFARTGEEESSRDVTAYGPDKTRVARPGLNYRTGYAVENNKITVFFF